jgi:hypothetical protein
MDDHNLTKYVPPILDRLPPTHKRRAVAGGAGALLGTALGSIFFGVPGAILGASIGGGLGVATSEALSSQGTGEAPDRD